MINWNCFILLSIPFELVPILLLNIVKINALFMIAQSIEKDKGRVYLVCLRHKCETGYNGPFVRLILT